MRLTNGEVVICLLVAACGSESGAPDATRIDGSVNANATLAALTASSGVLDPPFEPEVTDYALDLLLSEDSVAFTPTAAVPAGSTITLDDFPVISGAETNTQPLVPGGRDFVIVVTAASGDASTYVIHVRRGIPGIELSYQEGAITDRLTPTFDTATQMYSVDVGLWLQQLQVTIVPATARSTITINGRPALVGEPSAPISLNLGLTEVPIVITAPDSTQSTYRLAVTRGSGVLQQAYAKASNTGADDRFGHSVAIWGDTLAVGAPFEDSAATGVGGNQADNSAGDAGAVYIFTRTGGAWSQQAYLKASNTDAADSFGRAVALSGETLAVGAPGEAGDAGAVYVFTRSGGAWSQQAYLQASNTAGGYAFAESVALWGDTLAVGACNEASAATGVGGNQADSSTSGAGAVYVFARAAGAWSQRAYVKSSNTGTGDHFGCSVALWGDTLAVGAYGEGSNATGVGGNQADNSASGAGAVYIFTRLSGIWSQQAYLKASNTGADDQFGRSIALSGDTLVIGAPYEDSAAAGVDGNQADNTAAFAGAVYLFMRTGGTWSQEAYLKASNTGAGDFFGWSVALWGDTLAVGAFGEASAATGMGGPQGDNSATEAGAVYVFTRTGWSWWSQQAYLKASNTNGVDRFGWSVALWGDTMAVGAHGERSAATGVGGNQADNSVATSGAVYAFR